MSVQFRFVDGEFMESFKDEPVVYSRKAVDFQKVDLSFNDFSKSFMIPATPTNNEIFKHYYRPEVINSFNPFTENKAEMWVNGELYSTGQITLIDIDVINGEPRQYSLQFYSDTIDLKSALRDKGIDQLSWSGLDHLADAEKVLDYLEGGAVGSTSLKYVMASTDNFWSWEGFDDVEGVRQIKSNKDGILNTEVRPAIPVSDVMDKIFSDAGFDYEVDFDTEDYYSELYMWIHNGKRFIAVANQFAGGTNTGQANIGTTPQRLDLVNETINELKMLSTITDTFTIANDAALDYDLGVKFNFTILNPSALPQWRYVKNGVPSAWVNMIDNTEVITNLPLLVGGDTIQIEVFNGSVIDLNSTFGINRAGAYISNTSTSGIDYFITNSFMPTMKCIEFVRGILVTFNAIMYWDIENQKFVIQKREDWYTAGKEVDITNEVDTSKSKIKPPTFYKEFGFEFEEGKDFRNVEYKGVNNRIYGGSRYNTGMYAGDVYENKNPFTPSIWTEVVTQTNNGTISYSSDVASTQAINDAFAAVDPGVRLMYYNGLKNTISNQEYKVVDGDGVLGGTSDIYNFFISALQSDNNLNLSYNSELDFKSSGGVLLDNTLFTNFYQSYIESIYNPNVRRLNINAYIPYNKLKSIQTNDTIVINNVRFYIDGITVDLTTNKATFDLINKL